MRHQTSPIVAAAFIALVAVPVRAGESAEKARHADIRKLMDLTGAGALGVQAARQMLPAMRQLVPGAPDSFWDEVGEKLDADAIVEMVVPIYAKYLDGKDVKELIAFYESPVGRKLTRVQPAILQESMAVGQVWGQRVAEEVIRRAQARGFQVRKPD